MQTVRIFPLKNLSKATLKQIYEGQLEAGKVWNFCSETHKKARAERAIWPNRDMLQKLTRKRFALHSQSVQMICHAFLVNIDTALQLKKINHRIRLPYKEKYFYPMMWPKQAVQRKSNFLFLPMGRGRKTLRIPCKIEEEIGACQIVWEDGFHLHVSIEIAEPKLQESKEPLRASIDLGQIHLGAVTTESGHALVVSGRGIRTLKQQRNKSLGKIARIQTRCYKRSRRWKKIQRAKRKIKARAKRRIRDLRHKATTQIIEFCKENKVTQIYVGNPEGVQRKNSGHHQNQRMSQWEFGKDISYLEHKAKKVGIECFNGSERGTSSHCPKCQFKQRCKGRKWRCRCCGMEAHRDIVGSVNMFPLGFGIQVDLPKQITYLRPGSLRIPWRSSSLGTGQSCFAKLTESSQRVPRVAQATGGLGERNLQEAHPL